MKTQENVLKILDSTLNLQSRTTKFNSGTELLGSVPGLDSMAVLTLIERIEDFFGIQVDDSEIDGSVFATVGTLVSFVKSKI